MQINANCSVARAFGDTRVALLIHSLSGGGAERVMVNLAAALRRDDLAVDLVVGSGDGPNRSSVPPQVRLIDLQTPQTARSIWPLARYLREVKPAAMLSALVSSNVAAVLARRLSGVRTRLVVSEHSVPSHARTCIKGWRNRTYRAIAPWAYREADAVVAVSHGVARELVDDYKIRRDFVHRIYNPVIPSGVDARGREPVDHLWLARTDVPIVVAAGRFERVKDFSTLLEAVALIRRQRPIRLLLLGEGPLHAELTLLANSLGIGDAVSFPGYVPNVYAWFARASVLVVSSVSESFGNVIVEAMACGTPVVSTDCPYGPREILDGGRYGPLVPVGDAHALSMAIRDVIAAPLCAEVLRARAQCFSVENAAKEYRALLLTDRSAR